MSLWKIAWRSIQQRGLSSSLTGLSMALGVALVVAVVVFQGVISSTFLRSGGYHLIFGAKGGRLELVLNTVFHLGRPIENIPWNFYKEFTPEGPTGAGRKGEFSGAVDVAIPLCLGDNYKGYRVVATTPEFFDVLGYMSPLSPRPVRYRFSEGKSYTHDDFFGAVIGSVVARKTGMKVGDKIRPTHGVTTEEGQGHEHDPFVIRGVMRPTGTPNDRAVFINMEGFYLQEGHAKEEEEAAKKAKATPADAQLPNATEQTADGTSKKAEQDSHTSHSHGAHNHNHHHPLPESQREVTAILMRASNEMAPINLANKINEGNIAQAVAPQRVIAELFSGLVGDIQWILLLLSVLIVAVAGIGIMVSIYNSMSERSREIAVMRALGASQSTVMRVVLFESILLSLAGGAAGVLLGHGLIGVLSPYVERQTGIPIGFLHFMPTELILIPGLVLLAILAGYLPAMAAYRTDVSKSLSGS